MFNAISVARQVPILENSIFPFIIGNNVKEVELLFDYVNLCQCLTFPNPDLSLYKKMLNFYCNESLHFHFEDLLTLTTYTCLFSTSLLNMNVYYQLLTHIRFVCCAMTVTRFHFRCPNLFFFFFYLPEWWKITKLSFFYFQSFSIKTKTILPYLHRVVLFIDACVLFLYFFMYP